MAVITLVPNGGLDRVDFNKQTESLCGSSSSLYEVSSKGTRSGDPIADCHACLSYDSHTVLAVADGVGWGEPSRRAARCAVLGALDSIHRELEGGADGNCYHVTFYMHAL